ncbi:Ku protein [Piscinibacter sp. XHJ-5]|uniref:non-homologous end joining protein Ku n=1 Tax=Piscinibacter sp. XHJ-5 TaxID=3037797 RepID=UPI0024530A1F|nr:Ku protein [Piscinibacter sp. XHJ-5]
MRAIASLTLAFGLVSIPVKLYSATESSAAIRFKLMSRGGARLRQHYVADTAEPAEAGELAEPADPAEPEVQVPTVPARTAARAQADVAAPARPPARQLDLDDAPPPVIVEREDIVKGYEFEKGRFVLFTPAELKALQEGARDSIDIVAFIPAGAVEPVYYDKAYLLAPDKRAEKTYSLLLAALQRSGRCALAKWAWRGKQYVVEVRPGEGGMVLQQLLYADEVRSPAALDIRLVQVGDAELGLALKLIEQGAQDRYDPTQFVDEEKQRILAAVEKKIAGRKIVAPEQREPAAGQVIDLMQALRASLRQPQASKPPRKAVAAKGAKVRKAR